MNQFDDNGFLVEQDEYEFLLDEAVVALETSNIGKSHIEIIMQACGKSKSKPIESEILDQMTCNFDKIFGKGKSAPLQV